MEYHPTTANEFLALILEHKPDKLKASSYIGSFDWEYNTWIFEAGNVKYSFSFNHSAHAFPELPDPLLKLFKLEWKSGDSSCYRFTLDNPADLILAEST